MLVIRVLTCAPSEEPEDSGFCARAAAVPRAERDGSNFVGRIKSGREIRGASCGCAGVG